ncbi:hypothetical protein [Shinella sp. M27]|uniref:hypothetical protein n=1 Tax=Shinella sp. M27 TaxID=3368614 RepID=UPI003BA075F9
MARDGKPFGKLFLDEAFARMKPAENDIFLKSHHDRSDRVLAYGFRLGFAGRQFLHVFLDPHVSSPVQSRIHPYLKLTIHTGDKIVDKNVVYFVDAEISLVLSMAS